MSPELREAAQEAARRAGVSVDEWLAAAGVQRKPLGAGSISERLVDLSRRVGSFGGAQGAADMSSVRGARLSETVAKLNARLEEMTRATAAMPADTGSDASAPSDLSMDSALAEIAARQRALDEAPDAPALQPAAGHGPDLSGLEKQLNTISAQIEALRRPPDAEDAVAGLRSDLAAITRAVQDAMPRRALESLQGDLHALAERIDGKHERGADPAALEGIERGLAQVHSTLSAMTPAENLAGFDARISDLSRKLDGFAATGATGGTSDPETLRYLEAAIHELRELSSGVASAEGVAMLAGEVQALGSRIDHIADVTGATGLDKLAMRVSELTQALDTRVAEMGPLPTSLETLVRSLSDKLDRAETSNREAGALEQLERQIMGLADKIEAADQKIGNLGAIERGIQQLTVQVREARQDAAATAEQVARTIAADLANVLPKSDADVTALKRDLESLHANQSETDQRTHDTLEAVHDTLERLVERLAMVETDMRAPARGPAARHAALAATGQPVVADAPPVSPAPAPTAPQPPAVRSAPPRTERAPIAPDLPADTPLEPGTRGRSPAERIAASEAAIAPLKREPAEVTGKANFIAAARRAAQAAASEGNPAEAPRADEPKDDESPTSMIGRFLANRRRALMLGVSALLVLYGAVQVAGMIGGSEEREAPRPVSGQITAPEPQKIATPTPAAPAPAAPAPVQQVAAPTPAPAPSTEPALTKSAADALIAPTPIASLPVPAGPAPAPAKPAEVTGAISPPLNLAAPATAAPAPVTATPEKLPAAIGGAALRNAAAGGNAAAEYEVGVRYSEGRGVPANMELAMLWFERAANQGLAPAQYRLGSFYEKGLGVKKDRERARSLYLSAADKGNAKAIHNLAVLYAEGIDGKPDYRTASQWFRKAADKGIADSQYNLGILYARGIGVDQNLAESYKWFALAAQQGDQDAAKKRDDVAARLDQQSLVAARLAVQTWAADPPPDEAVNVKAPPGGWDGAASAPAKPKQAIRRKPQST